LTFHISRRRCLLKIGRTGLILLFSNVGLAGPTGPLYSFQNLGTVHIEGVGDGNESHGRGINDLQEAACEGTSLCPGNQAAYHAAMWPLSGVMRDIASQTCGHVFANAINNATQIVGYEIQVEFETYAYMWSPSSGFVYLNGFGSTAIAWDINNHGSVAGSLNGKAVVWLNGSPIEITDGDAVAINDYDDVAGWDINGAPFLYRFGHGFIFISPPPGYTTAAPTSVNNWREVVGSCGAPGNLQSAFRWNAVVGTRELPPPAGMSRAIAYANNDSGVVVGGATHPIRGQQAIVWIAGVPYNLNDQLTEPTTFVLFNARGINQVGQIICDAREYPATYRAFLLTPAPPLSCDAYDVNCNGAFTPADLVVLVQLLTGTTQPCSACAGDPNCDGFVNGLDIQFFVARAIGFDPVQCP
jgi:hypothetical protein